jgi:hypothetical protein
MTSLLCLSEHIKMIPSPDLQKKLPQSGIRTCCGMAKRKMYDPVCGPRACNIVANYILIIAQVLSKAKLN